MASELGEEILKIVDAKGEVDTLDLSSLLKQDHQKIIGAVKSLQSLGDLIKGNFQISQSDISNN